MHFENVKHYFVAQYLERIFDAIRFALKAYNGHVIEIFYMNIVLSPFSLRSIKYQRREKIHLK